jgi:hypothetical protein
MSWLHYWILDISVGRFEETDLLDEEVIHYEAEIFKSDLEKRRQTISLKSSVFDIDEKRVSRSNIRTNMSAYLVSDVKIIINYL